MERLIDMAARRLSIDPVELRLRNLIRTDEFPHKVASGIVWDRSSFIESLTSASAAICYARLREEQTKARAEGRLVGIGITTYAELTGIESRISAAPGMPINTGRGARTIVLFASCTTARVIRRQTAAPSRSPAAASARQILAPQPVLHQLFGSIGCGGTVAIVAIGGGVMI
jgi:CO/xanthine dehydrogenase Mo-binding subunit